MSCNHLSDCLRCGDIVDELKKEIESLREQVKELTDTIVECGFDRAKTEIESLHSECKRLIHEEAFTRQQRDEERRHRKELERRARIMWRHLGGDLPASMIWDSFLEDHPEAACAIKKIMEVSE